MPDTTRNRDWLPLGHPFRLYSVERSEKRQGQPTQYFAELTYSEIEGAGSWTVQLAGAEAKAFVFWSSATPYSSGRSTYLNTIPAEIALHLPVELREAATV